MRIFLLLIALFLAGCSGGTIGGLVPAPKLLKGNVEHNTYTAPDGSFKVALPYNDPYEWKYAQVHEDRDGNDVTWVIFGPAAFDQSFYHVVLIKRPLVGSLDEQVSINNRNKTQKRAQPQGQSFKQVSDMRFDHKGRRSAYVVFENEKQFLVLVILDLGNKFSAFDVDIPKVSGADQDKIRQALINRQWGRFNNFLQSFETAQ